MKGCCHLTCIPVRAESSSRSEMVTQLLLGERYEVINEEDGWLFIRADYDGYEGWISPNQFHPYAAPKPVRHFFQPQPIVSGTLLHDNSKIWVPAGAEITENDANFQLPDGRDISLNKAASAESIEHYAREFMGAPYLWGGRTMFGIDCSGFTQVVYKCLGLFLLRDAAQQATQGTTLSFITEAQPGDLAFFDNAEGKIVHVGIVAGNDRIIHAYGSIREDALDSEGIFNLNERKYTHRLRIIKSYNR